MPFLTSEILADFVTAIEYKNIPQEAIKIANNAILDWIGVTIAGSLENVTQIAMEYVRDIKAAEEAEVIGGAFRTSHSLAAWLNGIVGHSLDYDDTFSNEVGYNFHPSACIIPALLALGGKGFSGKDILTSYIVGIEIEARIGKFIGREIFEAGWHTTPVIGVIGATAACAKLMKLNKRQIQMALGIASSLSSGLKQNLGSQVKVIHIGEAAKNSVISVLLAKKGVTSDEHIMEGPNGFASVFSCKKVERLDNTEEDFRWDIINLPRISFKPYPSCRATHSSIDAALYLRKKENIEINQISKIICKTSPKMTEIARFHKPKNGYEGKFSIPYCIAVALSEGKVDLDDFKNSKVNNIEIQKILAKVNYLYPEDYLKNPMSIAQELEIILNNGLTYSHKIDVPKGEFNNPMTDEELLNKFKCCASKLFSEKRIDTLQKILCNLNLLDDVSVLMRLLFNG